MRMIEAYMVNYHYSLIDPKDRDSCDCRQEDVSASVIAFTPPAFKSPELIFNIMTIK